MKWIASFGNDFISQKVYVCFYGPIDINGSFEEYLNTRTVEELRHLERRFEKNFTGKWQVRFDDYSRLVNRNGRVSVYIWYPDDEEEREDGMSTEEFFEVLVKYNYEYDRILINPGKRSIGPRALAVLEQTYQPEPEECRTDPETGKVSIRYEYDAFPIMKECLSNRSEEELRAILAALERQWDKGPKDPGEELSWADGSGLSIFPRTVQAWRRGNGDEERSRDRSLCYVVEDVKKMLRVYENRGEA